MSQSHKTHNDAGYFWGGKLKLLLLLLLFRFACCNKQGAHSRLRAIKTAASVVESLANFVGGTQTLLDLLHVRAPTPARWRSGASLQTVGNALLSKVLRLNFIRQLRGFSDG